MYCLYIKFYCSQHAQCLYLLRCAGLLLTLCAIIYAAAEVGFFADGAAALRAGGAGVLGGHDSDVSAGIAEEVLLGVAPAQPAHLGESGGDASVEVVCLHSGEGVDLAAGGEAGVPQDVLQDAVAQAGDALLCGEGGLGAELLHLGSGEELVEVGFAEEGGVKRGGLGAGNVEVGIVELFIARPGVEPAVHLHGGGEGAAVLEGEQELVFRGEGSRLGVKAQVDAVMEVEDGAVGEDLEVTAVGDGAFNAAADEKGGVAGGIAFEPGELVRGGAGGDVADDASGEVCADLAREGNCFRQFDHGYTPLSCLL